MQVGNPERFQMVSVLTWHPCQPSGNRKELTTNQATSDDFQKGLVNYLREILNYISSYNPSYNML